MIDARGGVDPTALESVDPLVEGLISELVKEWMSGNRPSVKVFVDRHPLLVEQPGAVLELINQEIVLRQIRGESPCPQDYLLDFPKLAGPLSRLFEVHGALSIPPEIRLSPQIAAERGEPTELRAELTEAPRVPGYEIVRILGRGRMGVVYLAHHRALDRQVALKLPHDGRQSDTIDRARFEREAAAVAKCQHPNLVQIHEIGEHNGQSYIEL
jgi:serine/threonine-protein kinase